MSKIATTALLTAIVLGLSACDQRANDSTGPADSDTALKTSAAMGSTTQESVSGSESSTGDAVGATAPAGNTDQYGNFSAATGTGDASAGTTTGGNAAAMEGNSTTGQSGVSGVAGASTGNPPDNRPAPAQPTSPQR